jgi:hypothetical protein
VITSNLAIAPSLALLQALSFAPVLQPDYPATPRKAVVSGCLRTLAIVLETSRGPEVESGRAPLVPASWVALLGHSEHIATHGAWTRIRESFSSGFSPYLQPPCQLTPLDFYLDVWRQRLRSMAQTPAPLPSGM